ncbi:hypothetical protein [Microbispora bryophytorum]|uniref:hypothetical protein n=1 Tax=Microbispora bryophytorum TaxID=1460882 RepID=UPI0033E92238
MSRAAQKREIARQLDMTTQHGSALEPVHVHVTPELVSWARVVPPREAFGWRIQRAWRVAVAPARAVAVLWLWTTAMWFRFALTLAALATIAVLYLTA